MIKKILHGLTILSMMMIASLATTTAQSDEVTFGDFLTIYFDHMGSDIPDSYRYIQLEFRDLDVTSDLYRNLQKAVYLDMVQNTAITFDPEMPMTQSAVATFFRAHFGVTIDAHSGVPVDAAYLTQAMQQLPGYRDYYCGQPSHEAESIDLSSFALAQQEQFALLNDVYVRLTTDYYSHDIGAQQLIYGAAKGMASAVDDPYTSFFPPVEQQSFQEMYDGSYEGIGAIMEQTGQGMTIVSPFEGSPAYKAGLQPGDIVTYVDGQSVEGLDQGSVINMVKGPAGTTVQITVLRGEDSLTLAVVRKRITIEFIRHSLVDSDTYYIDIDSFGAGSATAFAAAYDDYLSSTASKLIIDVRNNPGGGIDEVHAMLSHFITKGQPTLTIKTRTKNFNYRSLGSSTKKDATTAILINKGSASASEILALTLQDYGIATIIGDQSFGKGSVQTVLEYNDGSGLKYTTHKRFSGKNQLTIDKVGVTPDVIISDDEKTPVDEQLQAAMNR